MHRGLLAVLLVVSFALRLWGIKQGLPYSYNIDEATHFVPRAVAYFSHDLNPHYFLNPPAYSYLLHVVFELWFGSRDAVTRAYAVDPSSLFVLARLVSALLGTLAVWITYLAARRFFDRDVGLIAAAIFGLAFLPIFYSHLALNDVPTLAPVALSLAGVAGVLRQGRLRDYALAGAGVGLAAGTKYTGGITLLCLLGAFACDGSRTGWRTARPRLGLALLLGAASFLIVNPYALLDPASFWHGVTSQASLAAGQDPVKLGTVSGSGISYYLWTFTWGLGWMPVVTAAGGGLLLLRRRRLDLALVLLPAPLLFVAFMGVQQRFFGRWLMPVFPVVAILGGYGAREGMRWLSRERRLPRRWVVPVVAALLLGGSLLAVIHDDRVLARPDTRAVVRSWMVGHVPAGAKVVIEPVVPDNWASDIGTALPWTHTGERWYRYATWLTDTDPTGRPLPAGQRRFVLVDQYERTLRPQLIARYADQGYCWVLIGSLQAGRAFAQPRAAARAVAYYRELQRHGRRVLHVSPFSPGAGTVPFGFDWSIDYYPRQYRLPGPELSVYRLSGGRCA